MSERAWQKTATKAGWRVGVAGLAMVFGGAALIAQNQVSTGENKGQNKYEIAGVAAIAPNTYQAKAMLFSMAGGPVMLLGLLSLVAGQVPLPDRKKDNPGPKP